MTDLIIELAPLAPLQSPSLVQNTPKQSDMLVFSNFLRLRTDGVGGLAQCLIWLKCCIIVPIQSTVASFLFFRMKAAVVLLLTWAGTTLQGGAHWNYLVSETTLHLM